MYIAINIDRLRTVPGRWAILHIESGEVIATGESHAAAEAASDALSSLTATPLASAPDQPTLDLGAGLHKDLG